MAGFSSPPPLRLLPKRETPSLHESLRWASHALRNSVGKDDTSNTFANIVKHSAELTPTSQGGSRGTR